MSFHDQYNYGVNIEITQFQTERRLYTFYYRMMIHVKCNYDRFSSYFYHILPASLAIEPVNIITCDLM